MDENPYKAPGEVASVQRRATWERTIGICLIVIAVVIAPGAFMSLRDFDGTLVGLFRVVMPPFLLIPGLAAMGWGLALGGRSSRKIGGLSLVGYMALCYALDYAMRQK